MFREVIKKVLEDRKRTQSWLAGETGIHKQSISNFLTGKSGISLKFLEKILKCLGIGLKLPKE